MGKAPDFVWGFFVISAAVNKKICSSISKLCDLSSLRIEVHCAMTCVIARSLKSSIKNRLCQYLGCIFGQSYS